MTQQRRPPPTPGARPAAPVAIPVGPGPEPAATSLPLPAPAPEPAAAPAPEPAAPGVGPSQAIPPLAATDAPDRISTSEAVALLPSADLAQVRLLQHIRLAIGALLVACIALAVAALLFPGTLVAICELAAVLGLGAGLYLHNRTVVSLADRRIVRETSVTRILQGLSRSMSPDAVVDAIVQELRTASGADHVVVARVRRSDQVVEVTLVAASPTVPPSRTYLRPDLVSPLSTDTPPEGTPAQSRPRNPTRSARLASQAAADEIARRVRSAYGLPYTLAAPLLAERSFLGALILSKRTRDSWSDTDRRLLDWAATEVSAAFARAYAHEAAERGANIDSLTGLPNRRYFDELMAIMRPRRRTGDRLGILMVDIDRFKNLNDRFGHATGDTVLRAVAGAIAATVRAEDTPARYGGEEFAIILRRASAAAAVDVAERIRAAVASIPPDRMGIKAPVTVSVGVAVIGGDADPAAEVDMAALVERADKALYKAKRGGRDRVEVWRSDRRAEPPATPSLDDEPDTGPPQLGLFDPSAGGAPRERRSTNPDAPGL